MGIYSFWERHLRFLTSGIQHPQYLILDRWTPTTLITVFKFSLYVAYKLKYTFHIYVFEYIFQFRSDIRHLELLRPVTSCSVPNGSVDSFSRTFSFSSYIIRCVKKTRGSGNHPRPPRAWPSNTVGVGYHPLCFSNAIFSARIIQQRFRILLGYSLPHLLVHKFQK